MDLETKGKTPASIPVEEEPVVIPNVKKGQVSKSKSKETMTPVGAQGSISTLSLRSSADKKKGKPVTENDQLNSGKGEPKLIKKKRKLKKAKSNLSESLLHFFEFG